MICPGVRGGAGLVPVVGLIRSLSARVERDSSQTCHHGSLHPDRRAPDPYRDSEDRSECLQTRWITSLVSTLIATHTSSLLLPPRTVELSHGARNGRTRAGTGRRSVSRLPT